MKRMAVPLGMAAVLSCAPYALLAQDKAASVKPEAADELDLIIGKGSDTPSPPAETPASVQAQAASQPQPQPAEPEAGPAAIPVAGAVAQEAGAATASTRRGGVSIEEVVVTAQRREEGINSVPIAITAFTGDALQQLGVTDTRDLGNVIPGLSVSNAGFNKPVYTLRGVGFNETSQTASSTVGVYLDEVNFPFDILTKGANLDIQRVEVLKGPQGTLYGRNTTGGAINYVSNKPTENFEAGLNAGLGSFLTSDVDGYVSGPLTGGLKARFAARDIHSQEGWQHSNTRPGDRLGKIDKQSARLIIDWQALESLPISLTLQGWRDRSEPQAPQAIAIQAQNQTAGALALAPSVRNYPTVPIDSHDNQVADWPDGIPWRLNDRFLMASLRGDWAIGDTTTLTLQGAYEDFLSNHSLLPQNGLNVVNVENDLYDTTRAGNLEARLAGTWLETGRWQVGAFASRDRVNENLLFLVDTNSAVFPTPGSQLQLRNQLSALLTPLGLGALANLPIPLPGEPLLANRLKVLADQTANTQAAFGHLEFPLIETLKGTLGLRYTHEVRDYRGCTSESDQNTAGVGFVPLIVALQLAGPVTNPGSPPPTQLAQHGGCFTVDPATNNAGYFVGKLDEDNISGRAAVDWQPNDGLLFYASYSRGFKSGSFPAISATTSAQLEPVKQERLDAFETGGKLSFLDDRSLHLDYAAFYYDYKDKQLLNRVVDPIFGPLPILRNAPKSRVIGAEVDTQYSPLEGLYLSGSATYLDTRVIRFTGVDEEGNTKNFAGNSFNFAPKFSFLLLANYVFPVSEALDLTLGADYNYKSSTNSVLGGDPLFAIPAYGIVNARVGIGSHDGKWSLGLYCRNLLDEFYTVSVFDPGDAVARYTGMTRTYGATLSLRFQ